MEKYETEKSRRKLHIILKLYAAAMGLGVSILYLLKSLDLNDGMAMLGTGIAALAIALLEEADDTQEKFEEIRITSKNL